MRNLHAFLKFLVIALSSLCALERAHAQSGCGCEPAGIRGWVNSTNGLWHGYVPFQTSPGVFHASKIQVRYLMRTLSTEAEVTTGYGIGNQSQNCWNASNGTNVLSSLWTYDAVHATTLNTNGVVILDTFDGSDDYYGLETDSRLVNWFCSPQESWTSVTNTTDEESILTTGPGLGYGTWSETKTSNHKRYQLSPTTEWITASSVETSSLVVTEIFKAQGASTLTPTTRTTTQLYLDPLIGQEGYATSTEVLSQPYDKIAFRNHLAGLLNPALEEPRVENPSCTFYIAGANRESGSVRKIRQLEAYVLGESGRRYLVWYRKNTELNSGLSKEEDISVEVVGAGPDTEAVAAIGEEELPPDEGSVSYTFLRLQPLDIAGSGPNAGPPGSGGGSGGGKGGSGSGGGNGGRGGCVGCGTGHGPGSWDEWGGGNVGYSVGLGGAPGGAAAGILRVGVAGDRPALLSRGSLGIAGYTGVLDVRRDSGVIRQVVAPESVADVQVTTNGGYEVRVFSRAATTSTNGAVATFAAGAVPVAVWRVEPDVPGVLDGSRVRLTGTLTNGSVKTTVFIADTNAPSGTIRWTVRSPGDLYDQVTESWTEPGPANEPPFRWERIAWRWPGGTTNVFVQTRKLAPFDWGWGVVETSVGEGADQKTTSTEYWAGSANRRPGGEIALVEEWDGNWTQYEYDDSGRMVATIRPNGTSSVGSPTVARTEYSYAIVSGSGDTALAARSRIPRTVTELVDGNVVGRAWSIFTTGQKRTIRAADPGVSWSNATNRTSWSWHYPSGHAFAGRFWKKLSEYRLLTVYSYSTNGSGQSVVTVLSGSPAGSNPLTATTIVNGTEITTVTGSYGETISQISKWVDGGVVGVPFASVTFSDFDDARRWRRMDLVDGTYETRTFDCCGLGLVTDRDGVTTQLLYDAAGRQIGSTRLGITVTNLLDPAGAAIRTVRVGSDGSTNLLSTSGYDTAGVLRASTNALGGVTTFAWSINANGELVESSVDPAGATQVVTHYRDGGVRSVTGTGVQNRSVTQTFGAQYMDVGSTLVVDGSAVTETVMDAEGNPGDYVITIRDALGQVRRVDQGNSVRHGYAYNRLGQMVQEVDADRVTRLYRYNAEGDIEYVAVDVNPANTTWDADGNPSIDLNQDRLIRQATDTTTHAGQTVRRQRRWEYPTAGSSTSVEVRAAMVTADARNAWTIDRGQTSAHALAMNRVAQTRNATNTAPDGSWTVAVYTSGRLTSRTAYASNGTQLSRETYGYDPHGRVNQVTDVRNGTRTQTYNAADLLVSDTTPASGTGQGPRTTTRQYSTAGRLTRVTLPDGAHLDLAYSPDGLLTNRSGGRQPTVGYAYDAAGRLTTLRTWKNATAQTGAKTTQWSYQAGTGFMVQKAIGNETPIQYTFTAAGRPRTEMVMGGDYPATEWKYGFDADPVVRKVGDVTEVQYLRTTDFDGNPATPDLGFTYDRAGRRIGVAQVTAGTTNTAVTWSRNSYGLITSESWTAGPLAGHVLSHTYDDKLRRTNLTFRVGTTTNGIVGYAFDASGRISWIGDGTSSATYSYVANSPLIQQMQLRNGSTVTLAVTRQYDRWNRLQSMTAAGTTSGLVGQEYTYNDAGQRIRAQLMDGSYWVYEYDPLGQVKSAKRYLADGQVVAGQQFEYSYDDIGNRTSGKTGGDTAGANLRTTTDTTDAEGRLSQRTNPRQYEVQGAAQVGTEVRVNGTVATRQGEYFRFEGTAAVATAQWLDQSLTLNGSALISGRKKYVPPQTEALLHDVAGNRTQDGRWEMRWDNENRLIDVRTSADAVLAGVPNQRLRYTYDADGRLIERRRFEWVSDEWSLAETTRYLNDGLQCVAEFNGSNGLLRRQVWGLDLDGSRGGLGGIGGLLWIVSQANGTHYAAPDGSGNVVALFGTSGTETARYEYGPFGELLRMSGTAIAAENPWRFSSKRQDPTTDWVHYEFRVYDPSSGRWLSRDPIGEAGGENLYGFVGNDPVNQVDLFGLQETGGGIVALQLMPPPVLPRQLPAGSTPCSASVPRISVPLPQCNPIADVIWGKPVQAPQPCPPRHFIGAPTPGPKIPVPRGLTSAEAYRYNSFLMAFGSSGLCDSPIGFRLAQINMQLINHAAAIPSQAQVDGVLRFGGAVLDRIGRCGRNLPRFQCTRSSSCLLEEATKWSPHPGFQMPAADKGRFLGDVGNSAFALSDDAAAAFGVPSGTSIPWREGIPDFGAHAVHGPSGIPSTFNVPGLTGDHAADRTLMLQQMAAQCGMSQRAVKQWLSVNNVRLHHSGGQSVQIVPASIHGLHHSGGAQQLRGGN